MINKDTIHKLTHQLQEDNNQLIQFDYEAILCESENGEQQTLAIKILSVIGGVLATMAFAGFLFVAGLYDSEIALVVSGFFMIAVALVLSRIESKIIWDTFSASFYLMGHGSILLASDGLNWNLNIILALFVSIGLTTLYLSRSYLLNFLSVLVICANIVALLIHNDLQNLLYPLIAILSLKLTVLFLYESTILANKLLSVPFYNAIRSGLTISILLLLTISGDSFFDFYISGAFNLILSIIVLLLITLTTYKITPLLYIYKPLHRQLYSGVTVLLLLPTLYYPSVSFSILLLLLSFRVQYKTGIALSIIAFTYYISLFYYDLSYSLMHKSLILFGMGLLFIAVYLITHKKLTTSEKS